MMSTEKAAVISKPEKNPGTGMPIGKRITHFLVSMKLALTLLFVIAILSIIGTILPQGDMVYETDWVNNPAFDFYKTLGLFDMYYSWWFLSILALLVANLSVCVTKRLPTTVKHLTKPRVDVKDVFVTNQPLSAVIAGEGERGLSLAKETISGHRYRMRTGATGSVLAEKGRFTGISSISFHLSFIVIAIGALFGGFLGFDETMEVPDGKTATVPWATNIQVKSNGFNVQYTDVVENGRVVGYRPSIYSTDLEVFEDGQQIARKTIEVNSPLRIRTFFYDLLDLEGINFHQNSFYRTSRGYVTVLGVNQKPGKSIIYIGFFMMMGGIMMALYFPHRRIWIKASDAGDLLIGGRTNRSKVTFQRDFDRLISELRLKLGKEARADG